MRDVWLSMNVEGDDVSRDGSDILTDWRIVVAPPLTVQNQLPIPGTLMIWEKPEVCLHALTLLETVSYKVLHALY